MDDSPEILAAAKMRKGFVAAQDRAGAFRRPERLDPRRRRQPLRAELSVSAESARRTVADLVALTKRLSSCQAS
jgi:hypothetical protein